jgi:hypothetical protein
LSASVVLPVIEVNRAFIRRLTFEDKQEAARIQVPHPIFAFPRPLNVCACVHIGNGGIILENS